MDRATGSISTQNLAPTGEATDDSTVVLDVLNGAATVAIAVTGTYTGALTVQGRLNNGDGAWTTLQVVDAATGATEAVIASADTGIWQAASGGMDAVRVTALAAVTGTAEIIMRSSAAALSVAGGQSSPASGGTGSPDATTQRTIAASQAGVVLQASGAQTATGTGSATAGLGSYRSAEFELDLTAAATDAGDTLDAFVQTTIDGTNWIDVVHFTQALGTGGAKRFVAKIAAGLAEAMFETGAALAAGSVRNLLGDQYRVRWDIVDAGTVDASFTFSVTANFTP